MQRDNIPQGLLWEETCESTLAAIGQLATTDQCAHRQHCGCVVGIPYGGRWGRLRRTISPHSRRWRPGKVADKEGRPIANRSGRGTSGIIERLPGARDLGDETGDQAVDLGRWQVVAGIAVREAHIPASHQGAQARMATRGRLLRSPRTSDARKTSLVRWCRLRLTRVASGPLFTLRQPDLSFQRYPIVQLLGSALSGSIRRAEMEQASSRLRKATLPRRPCVKVEMT